MSGLLWFVAGFASCLTVSLLSIAVIVWRTPPASEEPEEGLALYAPSGERVTNPRQSVRP